MTTRLISRICVSFLSLAIVGILAFAVIAYGYCETMSGPVAVAAAEALKTGDFEAIQIWVGQ